MTRYEIRYFYRTDEDPIEVCATCDHARLRAAKLSKEKANDGTTLIVVAFDNGKRVARSFAYLGFVYWSKPCKDCGGKGGTKYTKCGTCNGFGGVYDQDTGERAA